MKLASPKPTLAIISLLLSACATSSGDSTNSDAMASDAAGEASQSADSGDGSTDVDAEAPTGRYADVEALLDTAGASIPLDSHCLALALSHCRWADACGGVASMNLCVELRLVSLQPECAAIAAAVADGTATYDGGAARTLLAAVTTASCGEPLWVAGEGLTGGLAPGEPCTTGVQCLTGTCLTAWQTGKSACGTPPALGASCAETFSCATGANCHDGSHTCVAPGKEGEECRKELPCAVGLACHDSLCAPAGQVDEACDPNEAQPCAYGLACVGSGVCRAPGDLGAPCSYASWAALPGFVSKGCKIGLACGYVDEAPVCIALGVEGAACNTPADCEPSLDCAFADGMVCTRRPVGFGEACSDDAACEACLSCEAGLCAVPVGTWAGSATVPTAAQTIVPHKQAGGVPTLTSVGFVMISADPSGAVHVEFEGNAGADVHVQISAYATGSLDVREPECTAQAFTSVPAEITGGRRVDYEAHGANGELVVLTNAPSVTLDILINGEQHLDAIQYLPASGPPSMALTALPVAVQLQ